MKKTLPRPLHLVIYAIVLAWFGSWSAPTSIAQALGPDVQIVKTGPPEVAPGGLITYSLMYQNNSADITATGVVVTDIVPNNTVYVASGSSTGWSCADGSPAGTTCTFNLGSLAPGQSGTLTFVVRVDSALPAGVNQISNSATIEYDTSLGVDPEPGNNVSNRTTPVVGITPTPAGSPTANPLPVGGPDLQVVKIDSGPATPAGIIAYQLTYTNLGPVASNGVILTERVPNNTVFVAGSSTPGWSCPDGSPELTTCAYSVGTLMPGQSDTVVFAARVITELPAGVNEIANTVTIGDDGLAGPDPVIGNNTSTVITPLVIVTKGPAPTSTPVAQPSATATAGAGTATPGAGDAGTATPGAGDAGTATPGAGDAATATAAAEGTQGPATEIADPAITKEANPSEARVGDEVEFTITVRNIGNIPVDGVRVVDDVPGFLDVLSVDTTRGEIQVNGNHVEVYIGTMAPEETVTIKIQTRVNSMAEPPGNRNVATVASDNETSGNDGNNNAGVEVRVLPDATPQATSGPAAGPNDGHSSHSSHSSHNSHRPRARTLPVTASDSLLHTLEISSGELAVMAGILGVDAIILGLLFHRRKLRLRR